MADRTPPLESGQLLSPELPILASPPPPPMVNGEGPQQNEETSPQMRFPPNLLEDLRAAAADKVSVPSVELWRGRRRGLFVEGVAVETGGGEPEAAASRSCFRRTEPGGQIHAPDSSPPRLASVSPDLMQELMEVEGVKDPPCQMCQQQRRSCDLS
ncbi:unnamed protein product [Menidia menidia]|uniref:(Atlantic silverside) hypothetical protein n=1 Tax=Menidia menidia TaxID=238744 RepID=A0A8S4BUH1_9TELE|nr:unnamed protein product [Menidia menidia]